MIYLIYFFRSIWFRGFIKTIKMLRYELVGDKNYGIKTTFITQKTKHPDNYHYQGASYLILEHVFEILRKEYPDYMIIDVGCGKGRALFVAEHVGFNELYGIDIDETLVASATTNITTYKWKRAESRVLFEAMDALHLPIPSSPCIYYLFNPFSDNILEPLLHKIKTQSIHPFVLVYLNPMFEESLKKNGLTLNNTIYSKRYKEAVIYTSNTNIISKRYVEPVSFPFILPQK
jgi:SAM-dependent methyltransferase